MSFPHQDPNWQLTAEFILAHADSDQPILAPDDFWRPLGRISRYFNTHLRPETDYHWAILHKGRLGEIERSVLERISTIMQPVFANEVFIIWCKEDGSGAVDPTSPHLLSYFESVQGLPESSEVTGDQPTLPDSGTIIPFSILDEAEFKSGMNEFYRAGGYVYETLRDQLYYAEINRLIVDLVGPTEERAILDICCGVGRLLALLPQAASITGIDVADVAIDMARHRHADDARFKFSAMDAHKLSFDDASFDIALFIDAIEHVKQAETVIAEASRVINPGGILVMTAANSNSLNQIMARKLGFDSFVTNYQHIREFTFAEVTQMLEAAGLEVIKSTGLFLYPYWGVPGIDEVMRPLTDWDPEITELMRVLGERVGPEYAYSFAVAARKLDRRS